ncbi:MAG TPA: hypothetical protein VFT87_02460 [Candidatus Saccharimonadales bacterium]|nr:hypothetical protein [Candidatus Saccharimonadales bacterium]
MSKLFGLLETEGSMQEVLIGALALTSIVLAAAILRVRAQRPTPQEIDEALETLDGLLSRASWGDYKLSENGETPLFKYRFPSMLTLPSETQTLLIVTPKRNVGPVLVHQRRVIRYEVRMEGKILMLYTKHKSA